MDPVQPLTYTVKKEQSTLLSYCNSILDLKFESFLGWFHIMFPYSTLFSLTWPHWAASVIQSPCPSVFLCVCLSVPSDAVFF